MHIAGARKLGRLKEAVKMFKDLAKEVKLSPLVPYRLTNPLKRFPQS